MQIYPICFIDYAKAFDFMDHNKLWKILKEMGIPDHLTCLLRNLYAGQAKSWTRLSDFTLPFHFHALEKTLILGKIEGRRRMGRRG